MLAEILRIIFSPLLVVDFPKSSLSIPQRMPETATKLLLFSFSDTLMKGALSLMCKSNSIAERKAVFIISFPVSCIV
jgi:hypothetical protein